MTNEQDKIKLSNQLDEGLTVLKESLKNGEHLEQKLYEDYHVLEELLYNKGKECFSISEFTRFESRLATIHKMINLM